MLAVSNMIHFEHTTIGEDKNGDASKDIVQWI